MLKNVPSHNEGGTQPTASLEAHWKAVENVVEVIKDLMGIMKELAKGQEK